MLKFFQLDAGSTHDIHSLHEPFHSLPHILHWLLKLTLQLCCQRYLVLAKKLAYFCATWRVLA